MNIFEELSAFSDESAVFSKGQTIFHAGIITHKLGIVKSGSVQIERNDFWGNRTVMDLINQKGFFAETYAITGEKMLVDVIAVEQTEVLFVNVSKILEEGTPEQKIKLTSMLLKISSAKNLNLSRKIMFTSAKNIRGRLNAFLTYQSYIHNSREFEIPFDRQSLADYLNVERTALSKQIGKMRDEGLLESDKNWFRLNK